MSWLITKTFRTTLSLFFDKVEVATITESGPKNTYSLCRQMHQ